MHIIFEIFKKTGLGNRMAILFCIALFFSCKKNELKNIAAEGNKYDEISYPFVKVDSIIPTNDCAINKFFLSIDYSLVPDTVNVTKIIAYKPNGTVVNIGPPFSYIIILSCTEPSLLKFTLANANGKETLPTEYIYNP